MGWTIGLYVSAVVSELVGLGLVVVGALKQRTEARRWAAEADDLRTAQIDDPLRMIGLSGAQLSADWLMRQYEHNARAAAAIAYAGSKRQLWGVAVVALGLFLGFVADLTSLTH